MYILVTPYKDKTILILCNILFYNTLIGRGGVGVSKPDKISGESGKRCGKAGQSILVWVDTNLDNGDEPDRVTQAGKTF